MIAKIAKKKNFNETLMCFNLVYFMLFALFCTQALTVCSRSSARFQTPVSVRFSITLINVLSSYLIYFLRIKRYRSLDSKLLHLMSFGRLSSLCGFTLHVKKLNTRLPLLRVIYNWM